MLQKEPDIDSIIKEFFASIGHPDALILNPEGSLQIEVDPTEGRLVPAFYAKTPETIKCAEQPPRINPAYTEISTQDFAEKNGFQFTNSMLVSPKKRDFIWEFVRAKVRSHLARTYVEERLHNPLECLMIADITPVTINNKVCNVGKGLFLAPDAKPLPPGTLLGIYSGKVGTLEQHADDSYAMSLWDPDRLAVMGEPYFNSPVNQLFNAPVVSSKLHGNVLRFSQYLPHEDTLKKLKGITKKQAEYIATSNVATEPVAYYGSKVVIAFTSREIKPGEQIGLDFDRKRSGEEFTNEDTLVIYDDNGSIVGYFKDKGHVVLSQDFQKTPVPKAPRENKAERDIILPYLLTPEVDTFDYQKRFTANVSYVFNIISEHFKIEGEKSKRFSQYVKTLRAVLDAQEETDKKFDLLSSCLNKNKAFLDSDPSLNLFKKELIFHMHQYNAGRKLNAVVTHADTKNPQVKNSSITPLFDNQKAKEQTLKPDSNLAPAVDAAAKSLDASSKKKKKKKKKKQATVITPN